MDECPVVLRGGFLVAVDLAVAVGCVGAMPLRLARAAENRLADEPFRLGLASGFPTAGSVVLWTRLAPRPLDPDAGMPPRDFTVGWEIALDERMAKVVRIAGAREE